MYDMFNERSQRIPKSISEIVSCFRYVYSPLDSMLYLFSNLNKSWESICDNKLLLMGRKFYVKVEKLCKLELKKNTSFEHAAWVAFHDDCLTLFMFLFRVDFVHYPLKFSFSWAFVGRILWLTSEQTLNLLQRLRKAFQLKWMLQLVDWKTFIVQSEYCKLKLILEEVCLFENVL